MSRSAKRATRAAAPAAALAAALVLSSCQDLFNAVFDTAAPAGVSASDGDYADRVVVNWSAPSLSSDKWKDYSVDHYDVSWDGPSGSGSASTGRSTSYTIDVALGDRAKLYDVDVSVTLHRPSGGTEWGGTASDRGFAIDAPSLIWQDGGAGYHAANRVAGEGQWYTTMLQEGFSYSFAFAAPATGYVEFFDYKTLEPSRERTLELSSPAWTCDASGAGHKFYVHVVPSGSGADFVARYGW